MLSDRAKTLDRYNDVSISLSLERDYVQDEVLTFPCEVPSDEDRDVRSTSSWPLVCFNGFLC